MTTDTPSRAGLEQGVSDETPRYEWLTADRQAQVRNVLLGLALFAGLVVYVWHSLGAETRPGALAGKLRVVGVMTWLYALVQILTHRGRQEIRFRGAGVGSMFRDCPPQYWLDGIPLQSGSAEEFSPDNVEAIELYAGPATTPARFNTRGPTCGTVVVWSRLPG